MLSKIQILAGCMLFAAGCTDDPSDSKASCAEPTAGPTEHGSSLVTDETWTADTSPHQIPYDTSVYATITLEACATLQIAAGMTVSLFPEGRLEAQGEPDLPVTIERLDAEPWASIRGIGGTLLLHDTTVDGGGVPLTGGAELTGAIQVSGPSGALTPEAMIEVRDVIVSDSASTGVALAGHASFSDDSTGLTVTNAASFALRVEADVAGSIPDGAYTGNTIDEILIAGEEPILGDMTIHDRGVPYRVGDSLGSGEIRVGGGDGVATLTIEPAVELRFKAGGLLSVEHFTSDAPASAALVAVGTSDAPIIFTSAADAPQAGDWLGIWFGSIPDSTSLIQHAEVAYAGGTSVSGSSSCAVPGLDINDAAIRIFGLPASEFVLDTHIRESATHGIDRGWRSASQPDFLARNTFDGIGACKQTWPGDPGAECPDPAPCP